MRVVGLVSGGKDSCYNLLQCVAAGHEIIALANLAPQDVDELDSYMYQSVGHMGVGLYAEALDLPLYRRVIQGASVNTTASYSPTQGDEVEDLYALLKEVKDECNIEAVSVGAVLSDYQRIRVENVCSRLGLVSLAYMWRQPQRDLMKDMIACGIDAILIKVAAIGLEPRRHLGKSISNMLPHLEKMKEKYHLNVCGEGGEYETFTLDCPIFRKQILIKDMEMIETSGDVGYLNFKSMELVEKQGVKGLSQYELVAAAGVKTPSDYLVDLTLTEEEQQAENQAKEDLDEITNVSGQDSPKGPAKYTHTQLGKSKLHADQQLSTCVHDVNVGNDIEINEPPTLVRSSTGFSFASSFTGKSPEDVILRLKESLSTGELDVRHVVSVRMYVQNMSEYASLNSQYIKHFGHNPPVRVCVEVPLPGATAIQLDVTGWKESHVTEEEHEEECNKIYPKRRTTMHVQGISHWAPANIGPYSQAVKVGSVITLAGMIGLVPGTMKMVEGGIDMQARLTLRHVSRVITAVAPTVDIRAVVQGVCFLTRLEDVGIAHRIMARQSQSQISTYVIVPALPRGAIVEWQTWACTENERFEYEEKGYTRENVSIRLRRRWYHDNSLCAVNTTASCSDPEDLTCEILEELINYTLEKADANLPLSVNFYYHRDRLKRQFLRECISMVLQEGHQVAVSLVPVLAVQDNKTLLALSATRH